MVLMLRPPPTGRVNDDSDGVRGRLAVRRVAIPLFTKNGYAATTVDEIASAAGISRRTFFRLFIGKQEILSCDHDMHFAELRGYLSRHESDRSIARAHQALKAVLTSFLNDPAQSRERYRLARSHPSLRTEELLWVAQYHSAVAAFLSSGTSSPTEAIRCEMQAAALVSAHNKSLREWLRNPEGNSPTESLAQAALAIAGLCGDVVRERRLALIETDLSIDELLKRLS